jgi:branched-chain amino acid transport system substrate-binding protein
VVDKFWVPIGTKDYSSIVASIPDDIDAIYVALGGADAVNFLSQYEQAGGDKPLVAGSITADQTVLGSEGKRKEYMIGTPSAGPIADSWDDPRWTKFVADYKAAFPDGFPSPSLFAHGYYVETLAVLTALDQIGGDLSDGGAKLRTTLASLELDTPTGMVKLDKNRNGVADIFLTEVAEGSDGGLYNKVVKVIPQVPQTMGMDEAEFMNIGPATRDNPSCP